MQKVLSLVLVVLFVAACGGSPDVTAPLATTTTAPLATTTTAPLATTTTAPLATTTAAPLATTTTTTESPTTATPTTEVPSTTLFVLEDPPPTPIDIEADEQLRVVLAGDSITDQVAPYLQWILSQAATIEHRHLWGTALCDWFADSKRRPRPGTPRVVGATPLYRRPRWEWHDAVYGRRCRPSADR